MLWPVLTVLGLLVVGVLTGPTILKKLKKTVNSKIKYDDTERWVFDDEEVLWCKPKKIS